MTTIDLGRPVSGDVIDLILEDHRRLELEGTHTQAFDNAAELGEKFATERNRQIDDTCGTLTNVRRIVAAARREGLLDEDEDE